jgi:hypothetical protein
MGIEKNWKNVRRKVSIFGARGKPPRHNGHLPKPPTAGFATLTNTRHLDNALTMKLLRDFTACLALATLATTWAGCQTHKSVMPVGEGYEEVSHPTRNFIMLDEPTPPRISFQYRSADSTVAPIWSSLYGAGEVIHDGLAIFVGDKAYIESDRVTHPRLFAVKSPALPLDITDEALRDWSQAAGKDFNTARDRLTVITPEENNDHLELHFEFSAPDELSGPDNWPKQSALRLDWSQVDAMVQAVKTKGFEQKDLHWKTPYIGEKR